MVDDDDDDDDADAVYYSMLFNGGLENVYEDISWIIPAHNMFQWLAFVIRDDPAVRISYTVEL